MRRQRYAHKINRGHFAIYAAIEAGDHAAARRAARCHMEKPILRYRSFQASGLDLPSD